MNLHQIRQQYMFYQFVTHIHPELSLLANAPTARCPPTWAVPSSAVPNATHHLDSDNSRGRGRNLPHLCHSYVLIESANKKRTSR